MGTWGVGPFDNDTAEDLLAELEEMSSGSRRESLDRIFRAAIEEGANGNSILPSEVIAAASVLAATIQGGDAFVAEDYPDIQQWLPLSVSLTLAPIALQALSAKLADNVGYWASWTKSDDERAARAQVNELVGILKSVAS